MNVRLDPQQVPARAELLLAAELDDQDDGERAGRIKVGAVLTRRLHAAEATETPAGAAYGNPLRGWPGRAPSVPVESAFLARTDAADAHGWRVYRVTPVGTVMCDEWIDDDSTNGGLALTRLRAVSASAKEPINSRRLFVHPSHETDRKETLAEAMAAAFGTNPPPESLELADDARRRALRWAPPGVVLARAHDAESGHADSAPAAELPAWMNG